MMPWLALLKRPKILTIIALVTIGGAYIGWQHVKVSNLRADVSELEKTIAQKNSEIRSLIGSVDAQNQAVDKWRSAAQQRAQAAHEAIQEARDARRETDEAIGRLQAREAMTCEEGIQLIDEALGL